MNGWGEVTYWPAERIESGDWTPAIWRSPALAEAAAYFANHQDLKSIQNELGQSAQATGRVLRGSFEPTELGIPGSFPILKSKSGTDGQTTIRSRPDGYWIPKNRDQKILQSNGGTYPEADRILDKAGHLLVTAGQRNSTARVAATASDEKYVGNGWMPITGLSPEEAKATAVFINSTAGRLQLMRNPGRTITFPTYSAAEASSLRIPDIKDDRIRQTLADCWERTKDMVVPQYRDGECEVRRLWDEAVADALGWDAAELTRLRLLLHKEPHVRGLGYGQHADEVEVAPADRERFAELADRWERDTFFVSNSSLAVKHPAHREIISMGESVVPLILERMRRERGHWFFALHAITGANPVNPADRGKVVVMQQAWLQWGEANGYV